MVGAEDDTRELIAVILEQAGAIVTAVSSTEAVLRELVHAQPDLLISSIDILRKNNYELAQRLRLWTQEFGEVISVIVLATDPEEIDPQEVLPLEIRLILPASTEPDALVEAIARLDL